MYRSPYTLCNMISVSEISFALSDQAALRLPTDPAEQEALLTDLIRMMAADGQLSEAEKRLFALAAAKMNFDSNRVNQLIDRLSL